MLKATSFVYFITGSFVRDSLRKANKICYFPLVLSVPLLLDFRTEKSRKGKLLVLKVGFWGLSHFVSCYH